MIPAYSSFKEYGEIRHSLEHTGLRIDQFDLLIGATAIHHNLILVTSNTKHFDRINELKLEDWK
ncbi:MAG: PIN domain-containing protein [Bacteroidaceae bacterium]|nr:PIN domain-containing protein [Bacteroidaceae bacterium]